MKRRLNIPVILISFLNISNVLFSQSNDLVKRNLKGKVQEVISYYSQPERVEYKDLKKRYTTTYDESGNELSFKGAYNSISEYDKNGYKVSYRVEDGDRVYQFVEINNDSMGNRVSETIYNIRKRIIGKRRYKRNKDTTTVLEFGYPQLETPKSKTLYDKNGNKIDEEKYDKEGVKLLAISYRYDENQLLVYESQFNFRPITIYTENAYQYNDNKDMVYKREISGRTITTYRYEYEYDDKKNWIKKTEYENDRVIQIQERKISYYD